MLKTMGGYRVVAWFENGAVLVARTGRIPQPMVIDTDGRKFSFRRYLAKLDQDT